MKKLKLIFLFIPIILFQTCNREKITDIHIDETTLNEQGKTFMSYLQGNSDWEKGWTEVINKGIPLANNSRLHYIAEHGIHYLLPILSSDKSIHSFAIFPFKQVSSSSDMNFVLEEPIIYSDQDIESKSSLKNLVDENMYEELTNEGYIVDPNFKPDNYQENISRTSPLYNKQYRFYYQREGKIFSPWTIDKKFLVQVFEVCKRICSTWETKYIIIVEENSIVIRFIDIKNNIPINVFHNQVLAYMSEIERSIKEVYVVPDKKQYILENIPLIGPTLSPGIYVHDFSGTSPIGGYLPTTPPSIPIPLEPFDPCASMYFKMRSPEFQKELEDFKKLIKKTYETTSQFTYNSNGTYSFTRQDGIPGDREVMMDTKTPIDGFIHTHCGNTLNVFSIDDLLAPYKLIQKQKIKNLKTFSMGLVTRYSTLFIFIEPNQYLTWARKCMQTTELSSYLYQKKYNINDRISSSEAIENLVRYLKQQNTGMILMEMGAKNTFKRLETNSADQIIRKKCNN